MRRSRTVNVNTRRGPGLMGTMARTAVIAGTATAVSSKTSAAMNKSAQAQQGQQLAQQQAQVEALVNEELAAREAQAQQEQLQQQLAEQQAQLQQLLQQQTPPQPVATTADLDATAMRITKLKELGALRDVGILTEAEFASEKARILAG